MINFKYGSLRVYKPAYSEPVSKPGNREGCGRKGIWHKNTSGCMAGFTLALLWVAAAGLLVRVKKTRFF